MGLSAQELGSVEHAVIAEWLDEEQIPPALWA